MQRRPLGRPKTAVPDYDPVQLLGSLGLPAGLAQQLAKSMAKLRGARQQGVLEHAAAVAAHLRGPGVGLGEQQLGELLAGCPELFSWPPGERAGVLFSQLMGCSGGGLTAAEVARCFVAQPQLARVNSLSSGLAELAAILVHSRHGSSAGPKPKVPAAQRTAAALLRRTPSAVQLVAYKAGHLQQQAAALERLGCLPAEVAGLVWRRPELLGINITERVEPAVALVCEELGLSAAEVMRAVVSQQPTWLTSNHDTLRARIQALKQVRAAPYAF